MTRWVKGADDERRARYAYVPERALAVVAELAGGDDLELPPPAEAEEEETVELEFGTGKMRLSYLRVGDADADAAAALAEAAAALRGELQRDRSSAVTLAGHNGGVDALVSASLALLRCPAALPPVLETLAILLSDAENRERLGVRGVYKSFVGAIMRGAQAAVPGVSGIVEAEKTKALAGVATVAPW